MASWDCVRHRTASVLKANDHRHRFGFTKGTGHCDGRVFNETLADTLVWVGAVITRSDGAP